MVDEMAGLATVHQLHSDPRVSTVVLDNFQRLNKLESTYESLDEKVDKLLVMMEPIHEDYIGRKAMWGVIKTILKYAGWGIAGLGALMGVKESNTALHWLSGLPR